MSGDVTPYTGLVTSEHADKTRFLAMLTMAVQPMADLQATYVSMQTAYDLDSAEGVQLDTVGLWVGVTRYLREPLTGVYFSWGTSGVGWGEGVWKGPYDPATGLIALSDANYRILLRAKIAANHWDGSIPGAYSAWSVIFSGTGYGILIQDNGNMTMIQALTGPAPDAVTLALFNSGELALKPDGVQLQLVTQSVPNTPYFGFGVENSGISGWGVGAWGKFNSNPV